MQAIKELEEAIELSSEVKSSLGLQSGSVKRAYLLTPDPGKGLVDLPCFINWPDAGLEARMGNFREDNLTVQVDFYGPANHKGAEIALAFFDATWRAFDAQRPAAQRLGGTVDFLTLRAERPLLETLEWNGLGYPGFHIFLDLVLLETVVPL